MTNFDDNDDPLMAATRRLHRAKNALIARDADSTIRLSEEALAFMPDNRDVAYVAHIALLTAYRLKGEFAASLVHFDLVPRASELTAKELAERADLLDKSDRYEEAIQAFTSAIDADPDNPDNYFRRASTLGVLDRWVEAEHDLVRALAIDPEHEKSRLLKQSLELGTAQEAAVRRGASPAEAEHQLMESSGPVKRSILHRLRKRMFESQRELGNALRENPRDPNALFARKELEREIERETVSGGHAKTGDAKRLRDEGMKLAFEGSPAAAVDALSRSLEIQPCQEDVHMARATMYQNLGQFDRAAADFTVAMELRPDLTPAQAMRGFVRFLADDVDGAVKDLDAVLVKNPRDPSAISRRAIVAFALGDMQAATALLESSLLLGTTNPLFAFLLWAARIRTGRDKNVAAHDLERDLGPLKTSKIDHHLLNTAKGDMSPADCLAKTKDENERRRESLRKICVLGLIQSTQPPRGAERQYFQTIVDASPSHTDEFVIAKAELSRAS